jgi:hypothetical protein
VWRCVACHMCPLLILNHSLKTSSTVHVSDINSHSRERTLVPPPPPPPTHTRFLFFFLSLRGVLGRHCLCRGRVGQDPNWWAGVRSDCTVPAMSDGVRKPAHGRTHEGAPSRSVELSTTPRSNVLWPALAALRERVGWSPLLHLYAR